MAEPDSVASALAALRAEITEARALLNQLRVHASHFLLESVLARYLFGAIAAAEVVEAATRARHPEGAEPVVRHLFEAGVDLMYLLTDANPDETAARTLAWNLLDWEDHWRYHAAQGFDARKPQEKAEDGVLAVAEWLASVGEDDQLPRRVFADAQRLKARPWHWSGKSRDDMLEELDHRAPKNDLVPILRALSGVLSDAAHPSPRWHNLRFELDAETRIMMLPDPAASTDTDVANFADRGRALLYVVRRLVTLYQERADAAAGPAEVK